MFLLFDLRYNSGAIYRIFDMKDISRQNLDITKIKLERISAT